VWGPYKAAESKKTNQQVDVSTNGVSVFGTFSIQMKLYSELGVVSDKEALKKMSSSAASLKQAGIEEEDFSRPMYNKDITYTGSVHNLTEFKSHKGNVEEFTRSNISIAKKTNCMQGSLKVAVDIIKEMTDFKLLGQNRQFLLVTLANFFMFAGFFVPYIYIPIYAEELKIEKYSIILSIIGKWGEKAACCDDFNLYSPFDCNFRHSQHTGENIVRNRCRQEDHKRVQSQHDFIYFDGWN
jgi:hypothetical protein